MVLDPLSEAPQHRYKSIHSYCLRNSRITSAQKRAISQHWPAYGLDLRAGTTGFIAALDRDAKKVLEIGFGNGHSLLQQAKNEPHRQFIGIEVHRPGLGQLLRLLAQESIHNVFLYYADALDVLELCTPAQSIDRLQLYFPDPWLKKKHTKRRLVQANNLPNFLRVLKPEGIWHIATDCSAYADALLEAIDQSADCQVISAVPAVNKRPDWRPETKFEQAGRAAGRPIFDILVQAV